MFPASCRFRINRTSAFIAGSKKNLVDRLLTLSETDSPISLSHKKLKEMTQKYRKIMQNRNQGTWEHQSTMGASGCGGTGLRNCSITPSNSFVWCAPFQYRFHIFSPCLDVHLLEVAGEGEGTKSDRGEEGDKGEEGDEGNHIKGAACRITSWKFVLRIGGFSLSLNIWHIVVIDCPPIILSLIALDFLNTYSTLQHADLEGEIGSEACTTLRFLGFRAPVWIQPYAVSIRLRDICSYVGWRVVILFWVCQP